MSFVVLLAFGLQLLYGRLQFGPAIVVVPHLALVFVAALTIPTAVQPVVAFTQFLRLVSVFAMFVLAYSFFRTRPEITSVLRALLLSAIVPCGIVLYQVLARYVLVGVIPDISFFPDMERLLGDRITGMFNHSVPAGYFAWVTVFTAIAYWHYALSGHLRRWLAALLAAAIVSLVVARSRTAWIGSAVGMLALGIVARQRWIFPTLLVVVILAWPILVDRFEGFNTAGAQQATFFGRLALWQERVALALERPVLGWGFGSTGDVGVLTEGRAEGSHNDYIRAFLEMGVVGLVTYMWLYVSVPLALTPIALRGRTRATRRLAQIVLAFWFSFMVVSIADHFLGSTLFGWPIWTLVALALRAQTGPPSPDEAE